jgi:hypothetical protein
MSSQIKTVTTSICLQQIDLIYLLLAVETVGTEVIFSERLSVVPMPHSITNPGLTSYSVVSCVPHIARSSL